MDDLKEFDSVPLVLNGRFRNFRWSMPFADYLEKKELILQFANSKCRYLYLQEERSDAGFHHIEVFCNTVNSMSSNAVKVALGLNYVWGVPLADLEMEYDYVRKEDTRVPDGVVLSIGVLPKTLKSNKEIYRTLLTFDTVDAGLKYLKDKDPQTYVLKRQSIEACLLRETRKRVVRDFAEEFIEEKININDGLTHIFVGNTGIGKTSFALNHFKNPVLISDRQDFAKIDSQADGIVIDDFTFKYWLATNVLHVVDVSLDRSINVKYGTATLPGGLPRIITLNDLQLFWPQDILPKTRDAISRRISIHDFGDRVLYSKRRKVEVPVDPIMSPIASPNHVCDVTISNMPILSPICEKIDLNVSDNLDLSIPRIVDDSDIEIISVVSPVPQELVPNLQERNVFDVLMGNHRSFGVDLDDSFDYFRLGEQGYSNSDEWPPLSLPSDFFVEFDAMKPLDLSIKSN